MWNIRPASKIETTGLRVWPKYLYYFLGCVQDPIEWLAEKRQACRVASQHVRILALGELFHESSNSPSHEARGDVQEQIAAILSAYDELIENNRRRIVLLEEAARLLYREWFVHFRFPGHEHSQDHRRRARGMGAALTLGDVVEVVRDTVKNVTISTDRRQVTLASCSRWIPKPVVHYWRHWELA